MGGEPLEYSSPAGNPNPSGGGGDAASLGAKKKVVVVMGATGAGKSRLAIDLASHIPGVEIINADSMQVYRGLDVLTNKVPLHQRNGVPHYLLGTVDPSDEFTSKDFRDLAIPVIDDILSRNCLPVIVGGTNYYIQALVSPFLVDDLVEDMADCSLNVQHDDTSSVDTIANYDRLKEIDPVAANRIHPNDHRKISHYLDLHASLGVLPSDIFQGKAAEKWGRIDNFRYNCCFIWVDASPPVLDTHVNKRVDCMIEEGLLHEVYDIYHPNADYTRGLRQAIGVREFEDFFTEYFDSVPSNEQAKESGCSHIAEHAIPGLRNKVDKASRPKFSEIISSDDIKLKNLLGEAIDMVKANTRKLGRRQKRRLNRLKTYFGWDLHYIDATEAVSCNSEESWLLKVLEPCADIVKTFLLEEGSLTGTSSLSDDQNQSLASRELWVQYVCEVCGNQILRGRHEWEQHRQGRTHRKRSCRLKKRLLSPKQASHMTNMPLDTGLH